MTTTIILSMVAIFIATNAIWVSIFTHYMSKKNELWMLTETMRYNQWRLRKIAQSGERKWLWELEGIKRILKQDNLWNNSKNSASVSITISILNGWNPFVLDFTCMSLLSLVVNI